MTFEKNDKNVETIIGDSLADRNLPTAVYQGGEQQNGDHHAK